ncbi:hypothetical protein CDAR_62891 [Caerostris darwini]|uniref:Uncharacterized protein n=1 Tax=Caerostris darwini TaxID=1538125 RepID=A0AAV4UF98_9ARAC|nr:hypothetical protein CDAR_62891 [Caerostris darwini]
MVIEKEHKKAAVLRRNPETSKGFCSMKEPADGKPPKCSIRQGTVKKTAPILPSETYSVKFWHLSTTVYQEINAIVSLSLQAHKRSQLPHMPCFNKKDKHDAPFKQTSGRKMKQSCCLGTSMKRSEHATGHPKWSMNTSLLKMEQEQEKISYGGQSSRSK